jgi:hypothetical protein
MNAVEQTVPLKVFVFSSAITLYLQCGCLAGDLRPAALTRGELRDRLLEANSRIRAWYLEYESRGPGRAGEGVSDVHRVVAAKMPDLFFHWSSHTHPRLDWREDLYQQRLTLFPDRAVAERPAHRQFCVIPLPGDAPLPGTMPQEFLFLALGWWPFPHRPPPRMAGDAASVLPAMASSPRYALRAHQELLCGRWCHVLEYARHDKVWLDLGRGCVIVAREAYNSETGGILQRVESREHREVQPGIWVPFEFGNTIFGTASSASEGTRVFKTVDATLHVLEVRLNGDVQDSVFRFEPLPGSVETDANERTRQVVPGGLDYLEEVIQWINRFFVFAPTDAGATWATSEALIEYGIICAAVVGLLGSRIRARRQRGKGDRKPFVETT